MTNSTLVRGVLVGLAAFAAPLAADDRVPADVREHVRQLVGNGYCPAVVVGVVDENGASYFCEGKVAGDTSAAVTEKTLFEIGSITKVFTSIVLADMAGRKEVSLDDPVQSLLPAGTKVPASGDRAITLRDLATHRSGLPRLPDNLDPADPLDPYADYSADRLLKFLNGFKPTRAAGTTYEYSNFGAGLLGFALANKANKSYEELVIGHVAKPLGLPDTRIKLSPEQQSRLARGYSNGEPTSNWNLDALAGAGALRSTAADMTRFVAAHLGSVENPMTSVLAATHAELVATGAPGLEIGLGWHVWKKFDQPVVWHNGGTGGYHSFCGFNAQQRRGVVVLTNSSEDIDAIGLHVLDSRFELPAVPKVVAVEPKLLNDYVGFYELQPGMNIEVTLRNGRLSGQLTGQDRFAMYAESDEKFFLRVVDAKISFGRGQDGKVDHLVLHQNGDHRAKRLADYKPPVRIEVKVAPEVLKSYVGRYELIPGMAFDVQFEDGGLRIKLGDQPRFPVFAESETRFFYKVVEAQITFVKDANGKVTSLILHQGGRDQTARRVE